MSPPPGGKNRAATPSQRGFGPRIARQFLPSEDLGQESCRDTFPARIWSKNRAAIPSQRGFGARIAPRYLPSEDLGQDTRVNSREFDEFHFMCAALLSPNCRDAFLRLSQLPSLRDWRFYSAILLAETQECVSTTFRRTHVKFLPAAWREKKNAARGELLARHALS